MSTKEKIIESLTYIFENTKRIHGNSEAIDWIKVAIHKSAEYLSAQAFPVITKENDKQQKLSSIIHEVIWQYCFGKGDTDALFKYQDIGDATKEIVDQYFQPELSAQPDQGKEMKKPSNKDIVNASKEYVEEIECRSSQYGLLVSNAYQQGARDMRDGNIYISPIDSPATPEQQ